MNLTEFMKDKEWFTDFYVATSKKCCYYCNRDGGLKDYPFLPHYDMMSSEPITDRIVVADYYELAPGEYLILTTRSSSTYHCASCTSGPVEITPEQLSEYKHWILKAKRIVEADLGIEFRVKLYNRRNSEGGFVRGSEPNVVYLNVGSLLKGYESVELNLAAVIAHEARHVWQYHTGFKMDPQSVSYLDKAEEIDAFRYQDAFMEKHYGTTVKYLVEA